MRVGLISDIHGNLPALDAVLAELERDGVDRIVCLGDVAVGPEPHATVARVHELGCPVVAGNWDAAFLGETRGPATDEVGAIVDEIHDWWGEQLSEEDRDVLRSFVPQLELELEVDGVPALCFHGSPRSYDDWVLATTPEDELEQMFGAERRPLLVGGHTHVQLLRRWDGALLVNPGSVGLPFLQAPPKRVLVAPWAEYAVLDAVDGRLHVDFRRTSFDVRAYLRASRASGMPHADWWADCWVLN